MASIYIPFSTGEGQTAKIAHYIADVLRARGEHAQTADIKQSDGSIPGAYDGVIVGASIHMGKHDKHAVDYVRNNRTALEKLPSALFSVSLAAHGDTEEAAGYVEEFEHDTGWRPVRIALFGGALLQPVWVPQAAHDEEGREWQTRQSRYRHFPRLRVHGMGRRPAIC